MISELLWPFNTFIFSSLVILCHDWPLLLSPSYYPVIVFSSWNPPQLFIKHSVLQSSKSSFIWTLYFFLLSFFINYFLTFQSSFSLSPFFLLPPPLAICSLERVRPPLESLLSLSHLLFEAGSWHLFTPPHTHLCV